MPALTMRLKAPAGGTATGLPVLVGASATDPAPSDLPAAPYAYYGTDVALARAVALPRADRPRRFVVADNIRADKFNYQTDAIDPLTLACAVETMALLGTNTIEVIGFGTHNADAPGVCAAWGIRRFMRSTSNPPFFWEWQAGLTAGSAATWAASFVTQTRDDLGLPVGSVRLFNMEDEPGWYYPSVVADPTGLLDVPTGLDAFRTYLQAQGLVPSDVGETQWADVLPILQSAAVDLPTARLYVWTMRYISDSFAGAMGLYTDAARAAFGPQLLTEANFNNYFARWYIPSPGQTILNNPDTSADAAYASGDWFQFGRVGAVRALWTEDWFANILAQHWSLLGDLLRSSAQLTASVTFGGYVVGRTLGDGGGQGPAAGSVAKVFALLGRGAKALFWYNFGPEEHFPDNGWSNNPNAYPQIAAANRLIARSEDLLYPGQPVARTIAILFPVHAWLWDSHAVEAGPSDDGPLFQEEIIGLHYALMHAGYMVDFLSETDVVDRLDAYSLLYVVVPNVAQAAQTKIASWIAAGGVAWFGPGAAASDEYNQACTTLNATRGITAQVLARKYRNEDFNTTAFTLTMLDVAVNGVHLATPDTDTYARQTERLTVTTATTLATYDDDDTPAIVYRAAGSGYALSSGVWIAAYYYDTPFRGGAGEHFYTGWDARRRGLVTAPAQIAGHVKPAEVDAAMVEVQRLDSAAGIAVTLLNWDDQTPLAALTLTVRDCPTIGRVVLASARRAVSFSQVAGTVTVTLPLAIVEVVKLYAV